MLSFEQILNWLREDDPARLQRLWDQADTVRGQHVGQAVHLRGLVEISSYCERSCHYCGLRASNRQLPRYRVTRDEVLRSAQEIVRRGYGTIVLQAGEDSGLDCDWLCPLVREIKRQTPLAVTFSLGERSERELFLLREAGADRYLLRFETSNLDLFHRIHPPRIVGDTSVVDWDSDSTPGDGRDSVPTHGQDGELAECSSRIRQLGVARRLGFEVGSGVMVGIPGQTYRDLARDIQLFHELDLDMIGIGPFIPHPRTPLGRTGDQIRAATEDQVPADELMTYKAVALTRLVRPRANIPCTSALATINGRQGRILCLQRGANVIMPNMTPEKYRRQYEIYPNKAGSSQTLAESDAVIKQQIHQAGRTVGRGRGDSPNLLAHAATDLQTTSVERSSS